MQNQNLNIKIKIILAPKLHTRLKIAKLNRFWGQIYDFRGKVSQGLRSHNENISYLYVNILMKIFKLDLNVNFKLK